ncbi:MAG: type I restriction enzyme S subunit [Arenicella sp.]|jgi:type I restriction enzyme S subunit
MREQRRSRECEGTIKEWIEVSIGEISDVIAGGTPKAGDSSNFAESGTGIPWLTPADLSGYSKKYISNGKRDLSQQGYDSSSAKLMPKGSLLFSSRAPIGYVVIANNEISTNQGFKNFVFTKHISSSYAYHYLRSIRELAESLGTGTTFKEISGSTAKTIPFILPPLAEQKVIADKLDTLLAQVETTKARLDSIPKILKTFRQSVLAAAVSGKLTEEWQGNTEDWSEKKLRDICLSISDGDHQAPPRTSNGIPFLVISNVRNGFIDFSGVERWVPQYYFDELKEIRRPRRNDILYTVTGSFGIPVIVDTDERFCFQRHIAILKPNSKYLNYKFLFFLLGSIQAFRQADNIATGTAQRTVALNSLRDFKFRIPPLGQQTEIVRRVEELFAFADSIEQKTNAALERVNNLTQSILAKAFRGELTADWRAANPDLISGENSAEALLIKIKTEREAMKSVKKNGPRKKT